MIFLSTGWKPNPRSGSGLPDGFIEVVEDVFEFEGQLAKLLLG